MLQIFFDRYFLLLGKPFRYVIRIPSVTINTKLVICIMLCFQENVKRQNDGQNFYFFRKLKKYFGRLLRNGR